MKLSNVFVFFLVLLVFVGISCGSYAQSAEELLNSNLVDLRLPREDTKTFSFDINVNNDGAKYLAQIRYAGDRFAFNLFDKDGTPVFVVRNDKAIFYDILNNRLCLFRKNISIVKILYTNAQLDANINFHRPNEEEKVNAVSIDFLSFAKSAMADLQATEKDGLITISGKSAQGSVLRSIINPKASFPIKDMYIDSNSCIISFNNIGHNIDIPEAVFNYPEEAVSKSGVNLIDYTESAEDMLGGAQMLQTLLSSLAVRAAFADPEVQKNLSEQMNLKVDWAALKAADLVTSAKLRLLFASF